MKIRIKRIDKKLPLPIYETKGSVGFDLLARKKTLIKPRNLGFVPANVVIEVPKNYMLIIASRSSTPKRKGLLVPHGIGIIDHDYCGVDDEIKVQVFNFTNRKVTVEKGEKIAQGVFVHIDKFQWQEINNISKKSRGGFGSTTSNPTACDIL